MEKSRIVATLALSFLIVFLLTVPTQFASAPTRSAPPTFAPVGALAASPAHATATHAVPTPALTFPRTVLIETFTGVWCIHCPAESIALHNIDGQTNRSVIDIAELHVCAFAPGSGPCLDNYVPPDNTSTYRGSFYNVCGFPNVFFDGNQGACGATNSIPQTEDWYNGSIDNASAYAGNVSITETATVDGGNVTLHGAIDSGLTGTYNEVTYLLEEINKLNVNVGYGPHDVDHVVRSTLRNGPVTLTDGQVSTFSARGALDPTWNPLNLSIISFVQQNSTRIVENANDVPVTTLIAAASANRTTLVSGDTATVSVHVVNSTTGTPLVGAMVNFTVSGGGSLTAAGGLTDTNGNVSVQYLAPTVSASTNVVVTATVAASGYTGGITTVSLVVNPLLVPDVPTALTIAPSNAQVALNWTVPASGGAGVMFHLYRASTETGPFSELIGQYANSYVDTSVLIGQAYWYKVCAQNTAGFSVNTSAVAASSVNVLTQGLSPYTGWWINIDSTNFSSTTNGSLPLFLSNGYYSYAFGPHSYAFLAPTDTGAVTVAGKALVITAAFTPRYAGLQGTVNPSDATVTINGSAVAVSDGAFVDSLVAGSYVINVTASGYAGKITNVTLTPGNISSVSISLTALPGGGGSTAASTNGLTQEDLIVIGVGAVFVVAAIVGGALMLSGRAKRPPTRGGSARPPSPGNGS